MKSNELCEYVYELLRIWILSVFMNDSSFMGILGPHYKCADSSHY